MLALKLGNDSFNLQLQNVALAGKVDCVDFKMGVAFSKQTLFLLGQTTQELLFFPCQPRIQASATLCKKTKCFDLKS